MAARKRLIARLLVRSRGSSASPELLRQNQRTPTTAATPAAIAPLFGRFEPSTVPGTAWRALCFTTVLAPTHVSQPRTA